MPPLRLIAATPERSTSDQPPLTGSQSQPLSSGCGTHKTAKARICCTHQDSHGQILALALGQKSFTPSFPVRSASAGLKICSLCVLEPLSRATVAHTRQSRLDFVLGFQVKNLKTFQVVQSSFGRGPHPFPGGTQDSDGQILVWTLRPKSLKPQFPLRSASAGLTTCSRARLKTCWYRRGSKPVPGRRAAAL